uniref:Uncharacterized protein LOC102807700 n=1 Tax=Saccoglossus kowalevskii TaxID=10224 RepID=A0ABM0MM33_SACKO|nr:PREDICTED: uncharacterized protein LOC102807700 [Saccoglossus kowalevskii]
MTKEGSPVLGKIPVMPPDDLMKSQVALLTGGRDQEGRPIITIPSKQFNVLRSTTLEDVIKYYIGITRPQIKHVGFGFVVDLCKANESIIDIIITTLNSVQAQMKGSVAMLYAVSPIMKDLRKHMLTRLGLRKSKKAKYKGISIPLFKLIDWINNKGMVYLRHNTEIPDCLSRAEIIKNHFETGFLTTSKEVIQHSECLLQQADDMVIKDHYNIPVILSSSKNFTNLLQQFKEAIHRRHKVLHHIFIFYLILQKCLQWYRKTLTFLPSQLLEHKDFFVSSSRKHSKHPYLLTMEWRKESSKFLSHHPPPSIDDLRRLKESILLISDMKVRTQARLLIHRCLLLKHLFNFNDTMSPKELLKIFQWQTNYLEGFDDIELGDDSDTDQDKTGNNNRRKSEDDDNAGQGTGNKETDRTHDNHDFNDEKYDDEGDQFDNTSRTYSEQHYSPRNNSYQRKSTLKKRIKEKKEKMKNRRYSDFGPRHVSINEGRRHSDGWIHSNNSYRTAADDSGDKKLYREHENKLLPYQQDKLGEMDTTKETFGIYGNSDDVEGMLNGPKPATINSSLLSQQQAPIMQPIYLKLPESDQLLTCSVGVDGVYRAQPVHVNSITPEHMAKYGMYSPVQSVHASPSHIINPGYVYPTVNSNNLHNTSPLVPQSHVNHMHPRTLIPLSNSMGMMSNQYRPHTSSVSTNPQYPSPINHLPTTPVPVNSTNQLTRLPYSNISNTPMSAKPISDWSAPSPMTELEQLEMEVNAEKRQIEDEIELERSLSRPSIDRSLSQGDLYNPDNMDGLLRISQSQENVSGDLEAVLLQQLKILMNSEEREKAPKPYKRYARGHISSDGMTSGNESDPALEEYRKMLQDAKQLRLASEESLLEEKLRYESLRLQQEEIIQTAVEQSLKRSEKMLQEEEEVIHQEEELDKLVKMNEEEEKSRKSPWQPSSVLSASAGPDTSSLDDELQLLELPDKQNHRRLARGSSLQLSDEGIVLDNSTSPDGSLSQIQDMDADQLVAFIEKERSERPRKKLMVGQIMATAKDVPEKQEKTIAQKLLYDKLQENRKVFENGGKEDSLSEIDKQLNEKIIIAARLNSAIDAQDNEQPGIWT